MDAEEDGDAVVAVGHVRGHALLWTQTTGLNNTTPEHGAADASCTEHGCVRTRNMLRVFPMMLLKRSSAEFPVTMKKSDRKRNSLQPLSSRA